MFRILIAIILASTILFAGCARTQKIKGEQEIIIDEKVVVE